MLFLFFRTILMMAKPLVGLIQMTYNKYFSYSKFLGKLRFILKDIGLDPSLYASHSFRRGGASFAFQAGVPIEMIKLLGDWKSNAVCLYLTVPMKLRLSTIDQITRHVMALKW